MNGLLLREDLRRLDIRDGLLDVFLDDDLLRRWQEMSAVPPELAFTFGANLVVSGGGIAPCDDTGQVPFAYGVVLDFDSGANGERLQLLS